MHTSLKVVKEAQKQLRKAEPWVRAALEDDDGQIFDPELIDRWTQLYADLHAAFAQVTR